MWIFIDKLLPYYLPNYHLKRIGCKNFQNIVILTEDTSTSPTAHWMLLKVTVSK